MTTTPVAPVGVSLVPAAPPQRVQIQLALDVTTIAEALAIAAATRESIDRIEVGTPLIGYEGRHAITALKTRFPDLPVIADYKIMDRGAQCATAFLDAGADGVIVQAVAPIETVEIVCAVAAERGAEVTVDSLGTDDMEFLAGRINSLGVHYACVHRGKDEQWQGGDPPFHTLRAAAVRDDLPPLAVAGGLDHLTAGLFAREPKVGIIIVGEAIIASSSPRRAAAAIRKTCDEIRGIA